MRLVRQALRIGALAAGAGLLAACGHHGTSTTATSAPSSTASTSTTAPGTPVQGGTATFAEAPGRAPDFILPVTPTAETSVTNLQQFSYLLYRPLVWPATGGHVGVDKHLSLFQSIQYSDHNQVVTVTLKDYNWSDGKPVSSRDITFFMNLVKANKTAWGRYSPGQLPDDVASYQAIGPRTVTFHLTDSYSPTWFTDNQLSLIVPLPQHAWDRQSADGPVESYDQTPAGARAVWAFLVAQAKQLSTFATNPLWQVVDGPWQLQSFTSPGRAVFVPNHAYSGPDTPHLAKFVEVPFASDAAELTVLRAGGALDVGYLPIGDYATRTALGREGYVMAPWVTLDVNAIVPDLANPAQGPLLRQLYVRQALEHLVPQRQIVRQDLHGQGVPGHGPVPLRPTSTLVSSFEHHSPYPFDVSAARSLLATHGWQVVPGGTDVCRHPGTGPGRCGAGVARGQRLTLHLLYATGPGSLRAQAEAFRTAASGAGVTVVPTGRPLPQVARAVGACPPSCTWQLADYGGITYHLLPTGDLAFLPQATANVGRYANPTATALIQATLRSSSSRTFAAYENYVARDLPWLWAPTPYYRLTEVTSALRGVTPQSAYAVLDPEQWYFVKR
ncbi:MAG TPA: ABC transporter substrate-binding protein [Acidimicrobiales bacterium]|nr:ABC transporter substrate-binding protein [Acidimicrobiales bacterium]